MKEIKLGKVSKYFGHIDVAAVEVEDASLKVGDLLHFKGHTTDFQQKVKSMQIEHDPVEEANPGDSIGIKVAERVRPNDAVYKVVED